MRALRTALQIKYNLSSILKRLLHLVLCPTEVTEVVTLLQIHNGYVFASHYFISEILEFGLCKIPEFRYLQKTGNSRIRKFRNCNH